MRDAMWARLGLDPDEWKDCRAAAREMSVATGARISPQVVAIEYAMARALEEEVDIASTPRRHRHHATTRRR